MNDTFEPCDAYPLCKSNQCDCYQNYLMSKNNNTPKYKNIEERTYTLDEWKEKLKLNNQPNENYINK